MESTLTRVLDNHTQQTASERLKTHPYQVDYFFRLYKSRASSKLLIRRSILAIYFSILLTFLYVHLTCVVHANSLYTNAVARLATSLERLP